MKILDLIIYRFKMAARSKELYIYIIGFPLIFMLIYGSFAYAAYSTAEPIDLGYLNFDKGGYLVIGDENYTLYAGIQFKNYLSSLKYNSTKKPMYNLVEYSDIDNLKRDLLSLKVDVAIIIPENFTLNVLEFSKSIAYSQIMYMLTRGLEEAEREGNTTLINNYIAAIREMNSFKPNKFKLQLTVLGDPTYSKATNFYEHVWHHITAYTSHLISTLLVKIVNYLNNRFDLDLNVGQVENPEILSSINVNFSAIGAPGVAKKSFAKLYYAVLVPGQIMQTIILGAVSAIYLIGYDIERGLLDRLRLTKLRSWEYIGSVLLSWGIVALFQSAIMVAAATALGYIEFGGNPYNYLIALLILIIAGILSASISLILVSLAKPNVAGTLSLITLLVISLFIAGYFPIPNPSIGSFMGRELTLLDLFPWRAGITGLKKSLMLAKQTQPADTIPDVILLTIWTITYSTIATIIFNKTRLKGRQK